MERAAQRADGPEPVPRHEPDGPAADAPARHRQLRRLQRAAGNRSVQRALLAGTSLPVGGGGRSPGGLPASAHGARRILGPRADAVTVETGVTMERSTILAETDGSAISLAPNAPAPDTPAGDVLLAHEAAHVVQQTRPGAPLSRSAAEDQADRAAVAAVAGGSIPALDAASGPLRFEAGYHQASLTQGMNAAGFTDQEQQTAYMANWARDVSQAFVPALAGTVGMNATMTVLQLMSQAKFGRVITPEEMGMYNPVEHIDAPAGQIDADFVQHGPAGASVSLPGRGTLSTPVESYSSRTIAEMYEVDDSGVPAYLHMSKEHIKEQARAAIGAGRTAEGLAHVGNFSHTVEDLFAHSNWIEAAIGMLIRDHDIDLDGTAAEAQVAERQERGEPPIETFATEVVGEAGAMRPVLMTGTFSGGDAGHDTMISIKSEAQNVIQNLNPFAEGGSDEKFWDLALEVLGHIDATADGHDLTPIVLAHLDEVIENVARLVTGTTAGLAADAAAMEPGTLRDVATWGAGLLNEGAHAAADAGADLWRGTLRDAAGSAVEVLGDNVSLATMAVYVKKGSNEIAAVWDHIKAAARRLPDAIAALVLPALVEAEKKFKKALQTLVQAAWDKAVQAMLDTVEGLVGKVDVAESNVGVKFENMKRELAGLRDRLVASIREVAPGPLGEKAIATLTGFDVENDEQRASLLEFLGGGGLGGVLSDLARADAAVITAAADALSDTGERVQQLAQLPDWARAGPSHSQIAKDHADSPFFGAAFTMAATADQQIMALMIEAWSEVGDAGPAPGLEDDFAPPEDEPDRFDLGIDDEAMDRERERSFLETRGVGEEILREGHHETRPVEALAAVAERLYDVQLARPIVGAALEPLIDLLRRGATTGLILAEAERVHHWLESTGDDVLNEPLHDDPGLRLRDAVEAALASIARLLGHGEEDGDHDHDHDDDGDEARSEVFYESQMSALDQARRAARADGVQHEGEALHESHSWARTYELDEARERAVTAEDRLMAEIDRVFAHPYDSRWWRPTLIAWCNANQQLLADYIVERNSGRAHHH